MSTGNLKLVFAIITVIVILLAGWYPFKKRVKDDKHLDFPVGETLATGVFLGAALLHMLPEANALFLEMGYQYPLAYIISGAVFLFFLWFEHLGKEIYHHENAAHPTFAILAWSMLSVHSIMLGTALGLNHSNSMVIMLFLAIITHKWAESFAIAVQLNKSTLTTSQSLWFFLSFSLMTPLGILFGWYFGHGVETNSLFDPILIAASAGTFLYLGTLHGLERCVMVERCCNLGDFSFVIIGFGLMAAVAAYV
ncbi:ZIP family metal transporter [Legionella micdadei]|uniref:Zinc transporter ZupT n=1 Tax=Legionella micdadei TaxID=451 RepID=A0A098GHH8_LEGMI|nr:ZIP family metal transporter [Legionella micdadei]ARG96686.1 zinc transporter [Legionella micdadei]ARG99432.1 zinc transporter [Legionella micdadei]KTD26349.1 Zip family transporter [Legionella micdadei]NSL19075.1 ZIP family metal transporter [Legionella micdadei]CEG61938.1 Zip family protein [Legionella micdadei]